MSRFSQYNRKGIALTAIIVLSLVATAILGFIFGAKTEENRFLPVSQPQDQIPTVDLASLYTFFPVPVINSSKIFSFNYVYASYHEENGAQAQTVESGSYTETISVVNEGLMFTEKDITIVGVSVTGQNYVSPCRGDYYWYVHDSQRFYYICAKKFIYFAAVEIAAHDDPLLHVSNHLDSDSLALYPEYLIPFDIGKTWESRYYPTVQRRVSKTVPAGTFDDCFQISFFAINYVELRYLCPHVGLVALEVFDHYDYYSAALVGITPEIHNTSDN